jgi:hypothetical protein
MIDELRDLGLGPAAFTSAARHDQVAWAGFMDPASKGLLESYYSLRYAPQAGGAAPKAQKAAATTGRAKDFAGPFARLNLEDPQYLSTGVAGDAIQLHTTSTKYLAIVFGGSTAEPGNFNSCNRIHNALVAAGYVAAELRELYTGLAAPLNTTFKGMAAAWAFVKTKTDTDTQIFYWNSWGHGTTWLDAAGKKKFRDAQAAKKGVAFNLDLSDDASQVFLANLVTVYNFWAGNEANQANLPYFEVVSDLNVTNLTVVLNGDPLPLIGFNVLDVLDDGTELKYEYRFAMAASDILGLSASNELIIDYSTGGSPDGDLSFLLAGPALGDFAGALTLPAPNVLAIVPGDTGGILCWTGSGILQSAPSLDGPWNDITGATSPYVVGYDLPQQFFRLRLAP